MRNGRLAVVLLVTTLGMAGLGLAGCDPQVQRLEGDAAPGGAVVSFSPAQPSPAVVPPSAAPPAASASASAADPTVATTKAKPAGTTVLGPQGLGKLKLGMSRKQAEATRMIAGYTVEDYLAKCGLSKLRGTDATVYFMPGLGLSSIDLHGDVRTVEGVGLGDAMSVVQRAYPDWEEVVGGGDTGYGWADVPGNRAAGYRIDVRKGKVSHVSLVLEGQKCIE